MSLKDLNIGFGFTGSFCTFQDSINQAKELIKLGAKIYPVFSFNAQSINSRFGKADEFIKTMEEITNNKAICTIEAAEPIGPKNMLDVFLVSPCTGNTLAKMNNGICDTPVLMAVKAHIRNNKPVVLAIATNDGLGTNLENIASMINRKHIYFVPFGQDDFEKKPKSLVAHFNKISKTLEDAIKGQQTQPILLPY